MKIEGFNNTRFGSGMKAGYEGKVYDIVNVDFHEELIGLDSGEEEFPECGYSDIIWVRCENCELLKG